jgi:hypothetical protein
MTLVLPFGERNSLKISAMISNLLRFPSEILAVLNILYFQSGKSKPVSIESKSFLRQNIQIILRRAFPTIYNVGVAYKGAIENGAFIFFSVSQYGHQPSPEEASAFFEQMKLGLGSSNQ